MRIIPLQSGSNGNCVYVEANGTRLLFDAGISGKQAQLRLAEHGREITDCDAVIISHDHSDHSRCMGIYQRKFGLPIYVTKKTYAACRRRSNLGCIEDVRYFKAGAKLRFGKVVIETVPTPHDGVEGVVFVVDDGHVRTGIFTDLGHVFDGLDAVIASLSAVLLESNYDPEMLETGPYPEFLKNRIQGPAGHLSNFEAAQLLDAAAGRQLQWACLGHLSEDNNNPDLAVQTHQDILGSRFPLHVASRYHAVGPFEV